MTTDVASDHTFQRDFGWYLWPLSSRIPPPHPTFPPPGHSLFFVSNGGPRLVLARMRRYSASLLVQESGFHQLVAEFNKGGGIPRASLAQEVAATVANAMTSFSQVCRERESDAVDAVDYFEVAGGLGMFFQSERAPCSEGKACLLISYGGLPFWPIVQPPFW